MMRYTVLAFTGAICIASPTTTAIAQQAGLSVPAPTPLGASNNVTADNLTKLSFTDETPTMKRQKLRRAVALRQYADSLMASNGGRLSPEQVRDIRREARAIAKGSRWR